MCGIAGIVRLDGSSLEKGDILKMTEALVHRGPNGGNTFLDGSVALGHRRLSVIDLTDAASQPMCSVGGNLALVFNGEIYNFQEKRAELEAKGHRFRSKSDTEVLLKLYEEYGDDCVKHLRGMFAFAIYDRKARKVFLARDRVGKKPLKYFLAGKTLAFASEAKALLTLPECPKEPDLEAVHHYLTMMYLPAPLTGFQSIRKLPAAHTMTVDLARGTHEIARYWELKYEPDESVSENEWKERILSTLDESTKLRMVADVPVGAFLSAGVDSAAVVAHMARHSATPVKTFTIGSKDPAYDETEGAALIAKKFGTDHRPIILEPDVAHLLPELVRQYEEPFADPSIIPTYLVARETRKDVTVALNGDGGDENFAGYVRYRILPFSEQWSRMPGFVHVLAGLGTDALYALRRDTLSYRAKRFQRTIGLPMERRYLQYLSFFTDDEKRALYADGFGAKFQPTDEWYAARTAAARGRAGDTVHRAVAMDIETYLADDLMPKVDLGTMAHGLEARSPFLDQEMLALSARIPARFKIRGKTRKWILRESLKGMLPDETLTRFKSGFRIPLNRWFRDDLKTFVDGRLLESDQPLFNQMFDRRKMQAFLKSYRESRVDYSDHVWSLLWLEEWMRQYT